MTLQDLATYKNNITPERIFYVDLFNDDIWGDNGTDIATVSIQFIEKVWKLHYIRIQSGIPYPFADYTSNVIDEYKKDLQDEQLYEYLSLHHLLAEFQAYYE